MRELNELAGIIKGINYDHEINSKEIERLEKWVRFNKHISADIQFQRIINALEKILEDKVIDNQERELIYSYVDNYLDTELTQNERISVLVGLVDGIISDHSLKRDEITNLYTWMVKNKDLSDNGFFKDVLEVIKENANDPFLIDKKEDIYIKKLSDLIAYYRGVRRIERLKTLLNQHKNIGIELIKLINDESVISYIHETAEKELMWAIRKTSPESSIDYHIIFISLVLIGMFYYDGTFYEHTEDVYKKLYDSYSSQRVQGCLRTVIKKFYKKTDKMRLVTHVLKNSIVPLEYLHAFYEFIFDIYKINFEYQLPENIKNEFYDIYGFFHDEVSKGKDSLFVSTTRKDYMLIRSTQALINDNKYIDTIVDFSVIIIKLIDQTYWDPNYTIYNVYFKRGCDDWLKRHYEIKKTLTKKRRKQSSRTLWKPVFRLKNTEVFLEPPRHKLRKKYDYQSVKIQIIEEETGKSYEYRNFNIREIIGGYEVIKEPIPIRNPLSRIRYLVTAEDEVIYDSGMELMRSIIAFNTKGEEIKNQRDYKGDVHFCHNDHCELLIDYYKCPAYKLGMYLNADEDTIFQFSKETYCFSSIMPAGVFGNQYKDCFIVDDRKKIPVYNSVNMYVFESNLQFDQVSIVINNRKSKLSSYVYKKHERNMYFQYNVSVDLKDNGIYTIKAISSAKGDIIPNSEFSFAVDNQLSYSLESDSTDFDFYLKSGLLKESIYRHCNIDQLIRTPNIINSKLSSYSYEIPYNVKAYQLDDKEWQSIDQELWIDDIKQGSIIRMYGCPANEMIVSEGNMTLETFKADSKEGLYEFDASFLKTFKNNHVYVDITAVNHDKTFSLRCYNKCYVNEDGITTVYDTESHRLNVKVGYMGKGNVVVSLFETSPLKTVQIFTQSRVEKNQLLSIPLSQAFEYRLVIESKAKGLSLQKDVIFEKNYHFLTPESIVGRTFKLKKAIYHLYDPGLIQLCKKLKGMYVTIEKIIEFPYYQGVVYRKPGLVRFDYVTFDVVDIEITSDLNDDDIEMAITYDGDGLYLDCKKRIVKDIYFDKEAPDIFSFIVSKEGC